MTVRAFLFFLLALAMGAPSALAQGADATPPPGSFEVVKIDTDLEVGPAGQSWEVSETRLRPLTAAGVQALQQTTLSYTAGYQRLAVKAYTLKKDGRRIDIPASDILHGHGETTGPGFEDTRTLTIVFPSLEIGDQTVLISQNKQLVPWFPGVFATIQIFPTSVVVLEARFAFTTQGDDTAYRIKTNLLGDKPVTIGGKTRRVWRYRNSVPVKPEPDAISEFADMPRIEITTLADYSQVAKIYADLFRDRAQVTPEIAALAAKITSGISDRRAQAKVLYEWVATQIEYVNIVLGAGGFIPHKASDVLKNKYGDCKAHVMLLQALLAAKGIKSSSVLIRANANQFKLPSSPSPFLFDHLISYIPEFELYLDSTARFAPFGILPVSDAGKSVVIVETGKTDVAPSDSASVSSMSAEGNITLNRDGSADGEVQIRATGADAINLRAFIAALPADGDSEYFRSVLGPGSDGKITRGKPEELTTDYSYSVRYHLGHAGNFSGPGAIGALIGYKPFAFGQLIASDLPEKRTMNYVCASGTYRQSVTITFPSGTTVDSIPPNNSQKTADAELRMDFQRLARDKVRTQVSVKLDRSGPVCNASGYAGIRPVLSNMMNALLAQIVYR